MNKKLNILLVTSMPITRSANLGLDMVKSLEERGHNVDIITKYKEDNMPSNMYSVFDYCEPQPTHSFRYRLGKKFPFLKRLNPKKYIFKPNRYEITNKIEYEPPVDSALITDCIKGSYDLVITLFWQSMITTSTLKSIYDKLKCPIFIQAVDMFPITGGCFYFWDCRNFMYSCGKCPGLLSNNENDQSNKNLLFKKDIYSSIEYVFIGNTWMCEWANKSPLFIPSNIKRGGFAIDQNIFLNQNQQEAQELLKLPANKKFIMFAGAANLTDERKGFNILVESIKKFTTHLTVTERKSILLILAGNNLEDIQQYFQIDVYNPGFMDTKKLAMAYAASDVYLSTTIEDAGPTMVNQALLCGCPVVAFGIGIALDIVETGVTGYRAEHKNVDDYTTGIMSVYKTAPLQKDAIRKNCRETALQENSFFSFATRIEQIFDEYKRSIS